MLNHLTWGMTKLNFKSHPDTQGRLHQPGTPQPLPGTLPIRPILFIPKLPSQLKITQRPRLTKSSQITSAKPPLRSEAFLIPHLLSLVVRPTIVPPCLNKGNLSPLRSSSFLHCLVWNYTLHILKAETLEYSWKFFKLHNSRSEA